VLVLVVTDMRRTELGLVATVRRHRGPAELDRQKREQQNGQKSTHGRESSGYGFCFVTVAIDVADAAGAMQVLERAHVLGHADVGPHPRAHVTM